MKIRVLLLCFSLLTLAIYTQKEEPTAYRCNYRDYEDKCSTVMPVCRKYTVRLDSVDEGKFIFKCNECEPGYAPYEEGLGNLDIVQPGNLPDGKKLGLSQIWLCHRTATPEAGVLCAHRECHQELPNCRRYTVSNIRVPEGDFTEIADYKCLECEELYEPISSPGYGTASTSFAVVKKLCKRKVETRECGELCQKELPNCLEYSMYRPSIRLLENANFAQTAYYQCLQATPGYSPIKLETSFDANSSISKSIVLREFITSNSHCADYKCRKVFPHCKIYSDITTPSGFDYTCTECRNGFRPKTSPSRGLDFESMYLTQTSIELCDYNEGTGLECDEQCQDEFQGCLVITVANVQLEGLEGPTAQFKCDKCKDGFQAVEDGSQTKIHQGWELADNVKVRCVPIPQKLPVPVQGNEAVRFPNCKSISYSEVDGMSRDIYEYVCIECEEGFEPNKVPAFKSFFDVSERYLCSPKVTEGPVACDEKCQVTFPHCENIEVKPDPDGLPDFYCHKCGEGYYPIDYEQGGQGQLTDDQHLMRLQNTIYLCSEDPHEVYIDMAHCNPLDSSLLDSPLCLGSVNCVYVISVFNFLTGDRYTKCGKCENGCVPRKTRPHPYELDQSLCQASSKLSSRLFMSNSSK